MPCPSSILYALDHGTFGQSFCAELLEVFAMVHCKCDFARTYITVHSVGVEETAGPVKPLMKIAFLSNCLHVTTYCVRREIKVELNYFSFSQSPPPANFLSVGTQFRPFRTGVLQVLVPL